MGCQRRSSGVAPCRSMMAKGKHRVPQDVGTSSPARVCRSSECTGPSLRGSGRTTHTILSFFYSRFFFLVSQPRRPHAHRSSTVRTRPRRRRQRQSPSRPLARPPSHRKRRKKTCLACTMAVTVMKEQTMAVARHHRCGQTTARAVRHHRWPLRPTQPPPPRRKPPRTRMTTSTSSWTSRRAGWALAGRHRRPAKTSSR